MTQVCETAVAASATGTTPPSGPAIEDVFAAQLAELEASPSGDLADLRAALVLAISSHQEALECGAPPEHQLVRFRELGSRWAASRCLLDPLLSMLRGITEKMAVVVQPGGLDLAARVRSDGVRFAREVLIGFEQGYESGLDGRCGEHLDQELLATTLLWGTEVPQELRSVVANSYAVVAVHWPRLAADEADTCLYNAFQTCGVRSVLPLLSGDDGYVLIPARDEVQAAGLCRQVHDLLGGNLWFAVSWRVLPEVSEGRQEARAVLALVRGREPGVYQLDDVLVDYAVLQDPAVAGCLVDLITPVLRQETLLSTLEVLIATNGNRSKAAAVLHVHRSTLDHRLHRIEQLTGCQPGTGRGVQILATALIAVRSGALRQHESAIRTHTAVLTGQ
jgi:hypothetical protein